MWASPRISLTAFLAPVLESPVGSQPAQPAGAPSCPFCYVVCVYVIPWLFKGYPWVWCLGLILSSSGLITLQLSRCYLFRSPCLYQRLQCHLYPVLDSLSCCLGVVLLFVLCFSASQHLCSCKFTFLPWISLLSGTLVMLNIFLWPLPYPQLLLYILKDLFYFN